MSGAYHILLCEDKQQEVFFSRLLKEAFDCTNHDIRVNRGIPAQGSGEQYVRVNFPAQLQAYRARNAHARTAMLAVVDADVNTVNGRMEELRERCLRSEVPFRNSHESVAIFIPRRNIETWIAHLSGDVVDEDEKCPKLARQRACAEAVHVFIQRCRQAAPVSGTLPSLDHAYSEFNERLSHRDR